LRQVKGGSGAVRTMLAKKGEALVLPLPQIAGNGRSPPAWVARSLLPIGGSEKLIDKLRSAP
jgi:hypothetical protein